jgi:transcriptional regulator with XRE-family HTH domain
MARIPIFGQRVAQIRTQRRMSQQELAEKANTSYMTIWRIERGEQRAPRIDIAVRLARALAVSLDYLVDLHGTGEDATDEDEEATTCMPQNYDVSRPSCAAPSATASGRGY